MFSVSATGSLTVKTYADQQCTGYMIDTPITVGECYEGTVYGIVGASQTSGSPSQTPGSPSQTPRSPSQTPGSPSQTPGSPSQTPGSPSQTPGSSAPSTSIASSGSSSSNKGCFAGTETVRLESGEDRQISLITAGDRVQAADAAGRISFSEVVFVPHSANRDSAMFVHITTASGRDIKMTKSHVLPAGACGSSSPLPLKHASQVAVSDCVMTVTGEERVSSVETIMAEGLYTIVTKEEFFLVNGIVASPFAYNHIAGNLYYQLHRFLYNTVPHLLMLPLVQSLNEALGAVPLLVGYSA